MTRVKFWVPLSLVAFLRVGMEKFGTGVGESVIVPSTCASTAKSLARVHLQFAHADCANRLLRNQLRVQAASLLGNQLLSRQSI
jgi:hypothetical protein